jgi:hypothetical protein
LVRLAQYPNQLFLTLGWQIGRQTAFELVRVHTDKNLIFDARAVNAMLVLGQNSIAKRYLCEELLSSFLWKQSLATRCLKWNVTRES